MVIPAAPAIKRLLPDDQLLEVKKEEEGIDGRLSREHVGISRPGIPPVIKRAQGNNGIVFNVR